MKPRSRLSFVEKAGMGLAAPSTLSGSTARLDAQLVYVRATSSSMAALATRTVVRIQSTRRSVLPQRTILSAQSYPHELGLCPSPQRRSFPKPP